MTEARMTKGRHSPLLAGRDGPSSFGHWGFVILSSFVIGHSSFPAAEAVAGDAQAAEAEQHQRGRLGALVAAAALLAARLAAQREVEERVVAVVLQLEGQRVHAR